MVSEAIFSAMRLALKKAWEYQLLTHPNPAVGASVVCERGMIISSAAHRYSGGAHAEIYALRDAYTLLSRDSTIAECEDSLFIHNYLRENHRDIFKNLSIVITLEPCMHSGKTPSCASLLSALGLKNIYYGSDDPNPEASGARELFSDNIHPHILKDECDRLLEPFRLWQKRPFVFFKYATRFDGTYDGGTISSISSRTHMHAIRDRCDLLIIGGESVRADRPTLDARLVGGKAPDVLILSNRDDFDRDIPLFNIADREVFISDNLDILKNYSLVMVEGGVKLYESIKDSIDWVLCYMAPRFGGGERSFSGVNESFELLHTTSGDDITIWMRRDG